MVFADQFKYILIRIYRHVRDFLGPVPGTLKNYINRDELIRVIVIAFCSGSGVMGIIESISSSSGVIFRDAEVAGLATAILTMLVELIRRLNHGTCQDHAGSTR